MLKNKLILALLALTVIVEGQVLTFDDVKASILSNNPDLEMYRQQAQSAEAMASGARAWDAPQVGLGFFMTPYNPMYWKAGEMQINGMNAMTPGMGNVMLQGKQMIPNPARTKANQNYQRSMSSIEIESGKAQANIFLFQAKKLYSEIQMADRKIKILKEAEVTLQTMITLGESKLAYNQEMLSNIYKAKSQKALLMNERNMMENEQKQKLFRLAALMNVSSAPQKVDSVIIVKDYEKTWLDTSKLFQRSDLLALENNVQRALLKQKSEEVKARPDFGIEFGHMFAFGDNPNQFTLMGMMSIPIAPWSSKMYKSSAMAASHEAKAYASQRNAMINESIGMIEGIKVEIASLKAQLKTYETIVLPSLRKTYELSLLEYSQNTGALFMALDARMSMQMASMQYLDITLKLLLMQAEYEKELQLF